VPSGAHGNGTPGNARGGGRRKEGPSPRETDVPETRRRAFRSGLRAPREETAARGNAAVASDDIASGRGTPSRARREECGVPSAFGSSLLDRDSFGFFDETAKDETEKLRLTSAERRRGGGGVDVR